MALLPVIVIEANHAVELWKVSNHRPDRFPEEILLGHHVVSKEHDELSRRFINASFEDLRSAGIVRRHLVGLHHYLIIVISRSLFDEGEQSVELLRASEGRDAD